MKELIDHDTKWWNSDLLKVLFTKEEVWFVCQVPVSCYNQPDVMIWRGTSDVQILLASARVVCSIVHASARSYPQESVCKEKKINFYLN